MASVAGLGQTSLHAVLLGGFDHRPTDTVLDAAARLKDFDFTRIVAAPAGTMRLNLIDGVLKTVSTVLGKVVRREVSNRLSIETLK